MEHFFKLMQYIVLWFYLFINILGKIYSSNLCLNYNLLVCMCVCVYVYI